MYGCYMRKLGSAGVCFLLMVPALHDYSSAQTPAVKSNDRSVAEPDSVQELLSQLETDYKELLGLTQHKLKLEEASKLLAETNDNSTWTNYSSACKILREYRAKAAVPLLLKYMIVHTERSSRHVMIPEYVSTLEQLTGLTLELKYRSGPEERDVLAEQIDSWWSENKAKIQVDPQEMDDQAFAKYVRNLLDEIRALGEFTRTRAERETCYVTNQAVQYNLLKKAESSRPLSVEVVPRMLPIALKACEESPVFAYETVWLLSEFCKAGIGDGVLEAANDSKKSSAVRLACWLAMYRAGNAYPSKELVELYQQEKDFERRLILLASMRWGNREVIPTLLMAMEDQNFEIASAAACAVVKFQPPDAILKIEKMLSIERESPLLVYNALAEFKSIESKLLLKKLLEDGLDGGANRAHMGRLLDAFETAWEVAPYARSRSNDDELVRARTGLDFAELALKKRDQEIANTRAHVDNVQEQLRLAEKILELRLSEYRRLSALLGDEIVSTELVQEAKQELEKSRTEVETRKRQLVDAKARLEKLE